MTTQKEQAYYSTIAKDFAGYPGLIVDLGCWLGSTSISLAKGVNISKEHGEEIHHEQIHAFDRFVWTDKMNRYNRMLDKKIRPGDSFLDETKKRIASHQNLIKLHEVDLVSFTWQDPRPIKILLVDAMKSSTLTSAIAKSFYPALKPNSVVIQQDFKHFNEPYIHVLHFKLRDHFRLEENVENSTTVAFRLTKKINAELLDLASDFENLTPSDFKRAYNYSLRLINKSEKTKWSLLSTYYRYYKSRIASRLRSF